MANGSQFSALSFQLPTKHLPVRKGRGAEFRAIPFSSARCAGQVRAVQTGSDQMENCSISSIVRRWGQLSAKIGKNFICSILNKLVTILRRSRLDKKIDRGPRPSSRWRGRGTPRRRWSDPHGRSKVAIERSQCGRPAKLDIICWSQVYM